MRREFNGSVPSRSFQHPGPLARLMSMLIWMLAGLFAAITLTPMAILSALVGAHRIEWLNRFYCWGQIATTFNRITYQVAPSIDPKKTYLFVQNHTNHFDHVYCYRGTPHFKQGLELAKHFKYPVYGWFMRARGTIPVYGGKDQFESLVTAVGKVVSLGHSVLAFPEGHRTLDGRLGPFKSGIFRIARELKLEIVPVTVLGAHDMMRKGSLMIRPGNHIRVILGSPRVTEGLTEQSLEQLKQQIESEMRDQIDAYWTKRLQN